MLNEFQKKALLIGQAIASNPHASEAFSSIKPIMPNALIDRETSIGLTHALNEDAYKALSIVMQEIDPKMRETFLSEMAVQVQEDAERMGARMAELGFPDPRPDHQTWRIIAKMVGADPNALTEDIFEAAEAFHALRELEKKQSQSFSESGVKGKTPKVDNEPKDLHDVTRWVRKNWHRFEHNQRKTVRQWVALNADKDRKLNFIQELNKLKNDLKRNPLSKHKKSD